MINDDTEKKIEHKYRHGVLEKSAIRVVRHDEVRVEAWRAVGYTSRGCRGQPHLNGRPVDDTAYNVIGRGREVQYKHRFKYQNMSIVVHTKASVN